MSRSVVILSTGRTDRGARATLALSWACTALAMGRDVTVFLTIDGAVWALEDATRGIQVDGFEPLHSYLEQFLALGGELLVCAPCTRYYCGMDDDLDGGHPKARLHPAVKIAGLSTVVARSLPDGSTVTF